MTLQLQHRKGKKEHRHHEKTENDVTIKEIIQQKV
jgi:hypothetical protein